MVPVGGQSRAAPEKEIDVDEDGRYDVKRQVIGGFIKSPQAEINGHAGAEEPEPIGQQADQRGGVNEITEDLFSVFVGFQRLGQDREIQHRRDDPAFPYAPSGAFGVQDFAARQRQEIRGGQRAERSAYHDKKDRVPVPAGFFSPH